ncbi:unnamed protein product [Phytophthora fragariaefolia]|uniref:Unnamed protein product n=1 Tax=Phytophthora fragariaefolia TaxID=1490495 RepID=A0A9W6Y3B7_9STRA|nr:unnamed protein product [Phytophthora fragariaefolia]
MFDSQVEYCDAQITEPVRSKNELLGVTLDWLATGSSVRAQENKFKIAYSTYHKYCTLGMMPIIDSLQHLISLPSDFCPEFALRFPHFNQALCAIDGVHFQLQVAETDAGRFGSHKGTTTTNVLIASGWNLQAAFVYAGVEGSAHGSSVLSFSAFMTT